MLKRGKPFESGNQFGRGRPPGSRNKSSRRSKEILEPHGDALLRKSIVVALNGDVPMLRTLLDRVLPRRRELPVKIGVLSMGTAEELSQTFDRLGEKLTKGQLTIGDVQGLLPLIEAKRRILETCDQETRIRNLEQGGVALGMKIP
jgi:hypothetical protein